MHPHLHIHIPIQTQAHTYSKYQNKTGIIVYVVFSLYIFNLSHNVCLSQQLCFFIYLLFSPTNCEIFYQQKTEKTLYLERLTVCCQKN